jgi:Flp pilus assembly protein TadG
MYNRTFWSRCKYSCRDFFANRSGAAALVFGMALIPIMGTVGAGVDYSRVAAEKQKISNALDGAVLALGRESGMDANGSLAFVQNFVQYNYEPDNHVSWLIKNVTNDETQISATAELSVQALVMSFLGYSTLKADIKTSALREMSNLELVMVLDNTGSMNSGNKIGALRNAAMDMVEILEASKPADVELKIGLVPFVTAVNVKADANEGFNSSWIDTQGRSVLDFNSFDPSTSGPSGPKNNWALFATMGVPWKGCVLARPEPYDVTDDEPDPSNPDTLFVPYFWPDEPDNDSDYNNNYLPDIVNITTGKGKNKEEIQQVAPDSWTAEMRQRNVVKYLGLNEEFDESPSDTTGPNKSCADPLQPLTDNIAKVKQKIQDMRAWNNSGTAVSEGIAWGWRVLSPSKPFTQGAPYDDKETRKIMVIMTDGENQIFGGWNTHNKSDYSSYGYLSELRLGSNNKNQAKNVINNKVDQLCESIKALEVEIYTVTFKLNSTAIHNLFRDCASKPGMAFNSNSDNDLEVAFRKMAQEMTFLRLIE